MYELVALGILLVLAVFLLIAVRRGVAPYDAEAIEPVAEAQPEPVVEPTVEPHAADEEDSEATVLFSQDMVDAELAGAVLIDDEDRSSS